MLCNVQSGTMPEKRYIIESWNRGEALMNENYHTKGESL